VARDTAQTASRPVVGVTGNARRWSPSWLAIQSAIRLAGGRPVRISVDRRHPPDELHAVIVSGGDDIHPHLYGGEPASSSSYDPDRDALEREYVHFAFEQRLPLLGICRGYQLINVTLGGSLHGDIRPLRVKTSNRATVLPRKSVELAPGSLLASVMQRQRLLVNSLHNQALHALADRLRAVGHDEDRFIQAVESHDEIPLLGVQWHPEYLFYLPSHFRLFRWLVQRAAQRMA